MSDDEGDDADPFEELEESAAGREGDPFENLDAPDAGETDETVPDPDAGGEGGESEPGDPISAPGATDWSQDEGAEEAEGFSETGYQPPGPGSGASEGSGEGIDEIPDPDAEDLGRGEDPFESADSVFERMDAGDLDEDAVWEEIADAESRGSVSEVRERTYAEVSKHSYCEHCEYFTGPPEVSCTHEGTEILEFLDMEQVRVVDCPIVAERIALEQED